MTYKPVVLSKAFEGEDPLDPVRAIRKVRHEQSQKKLFLADKNANLRSGARGLQARKDLKAAELKLDSTQELYGSLLQLTRALKLTSNRLDQDLESVDADTIQKDTQAAAEELQNLQSRLEDVISFPPFFVKQIIVSELTKKIDETCRHGERGSSGSSRSRVQGRLF